MSKIVHLGRSLAQHYKLAVSDVLLTVDGKNYWDVEVRYDHKRRCVVLKPAERQAQRRKIRGNQ